MQYGDDDLTGDQSSLGNKSLKNGKGKCNVGVCCHCWRARHRYKAGNVVLCLLSLLESKTQIKSSKCTVVFAIIVGEQDMGKKR